MCNVAVKPVSVIGFNKSQQGSYAFNFQQFFLLIFQIENEYGAFGYDDYPRDTQYLHSLKLALESYGMESLLFTSDSPKNSFDYGTTDGGITVL